MKKVFLFVAAIAFSAVVLAEINEPFCCIKAGSELQYRTTTAKGKEISTAITTIDQANGANGNYEVTQTVTTFSGGEPLTKPMTITSVIEGGKASIALGGGITIDAESFTPFLPNDLEVGKELGTGEMVIYASGFKAKSDITFNKCVAREEITTPAGTFDCFVVEQHSTMALGFIKSDMVQKTWYARGVGSVKTETYDKKGKLSQVQTLISFK